MHDNDEIDISNVKSVRIDKDDAVVEISDKQKELDSLMKNTSGMLKLTLPKLSLPNYPMALINK
jgi:hypothetical protein